MASSSAESSRRGPNRQRGNNRSRLDDDSAGFPRDLVELIFTYLPIIQCVQTGLVAKEFRNTWRKCQNLDFGRDFAATQLNQLAYSHVVEHVLENHSNEEKLKTLRVCFDPSGAEFFLDIWVSKAVDKGVEELELDIFQATVPFYVPISGEESRLKVLKLNYAMIQMPFDLKALVSLTTLVMREVDLTDNFVEAVFKSCALLATFDMADCYGVRNLKVKAKEHMRFKVLKVGGCREMLSLEIHAPILRCLYYSGVVLKQFDICEPMLLLDEAIMNFLPSKEYTNPWHLEKLVADISSSVRVLTITSTFLEGLAARIRDGRIRETQFCFSNLRELQIVMEDSSFTNAGDIASFIINCPRLESLFIEMNESAVYCNMLQSPIMDNCTSFLNALKFVKIRGYKDTNQQHERLAWFILDKARSLERMVIFWSRNHCRLCHGVPYLPRSQQIRHTNILASRKRSQRAEVILCDQMEDTYSLPKHARKWF